ncbi:MAG: M28 family peptidase [Chloroflexia bacterium]|nr:M28 family peptidase [Chloroflexia bacterium]
MSEGLTKKILDEISADRIRKHIAVLEGVRHPVVAPEALEQAAHYIQATLQSLCYDVRPHPFMDGEREYRNIIATRPGTRDFEKRVIVLAHYDTVAESPGANDNASGVAALLELARVFEAVPLDRTLQFIAVNLEERQREGPMEEAGLLGSRALAIEARAQDWQIEGVIVLETIACAGEDIVQKTPAGLPLNMPKKGNFICIVGNEASAGLVKAFGQAVERYQIPLPLLPLVVPGRGERIPDTRRSDHSPFWDNDYPAVMVTDTANFRSPHYHQPSDTLEKLNLPFAAKVAQAVAGVVADLVQG